MADPLRGRAGQSRRPIASKRQKTSEYTGCPAIHGSQPGSVTTWNEASGIRTEGQMNRSRPPRSQPGQADLDLLALPMRRNGQRAEHENLEQSQRRTQPRSGELDVPDDRSCSSGDLGRRRCLSVNEPYQVDALPYPGIIDAHPTTEPPAVKPAAGIGSN